MTASLQVSGMVGIVWEHAGLPTTAPVRSEHDDRLAGQQPHLLDDQRADRIVRRVLAEAWQDRVDEGDHRPVVWALDDNTFAIVLSSRASAYSALLILEVAFRAIPEPRGTDGRSPRPTPETGSLQWPRYTSG